MCDNGNGSSNQVVDVDFIKESHWDQESNDITMSTVKMKNLASYSSGFINYVSFQDSFDGQNKLIGSSPNAAYSPIHNLMLRPYHPQSAEDVGTAQYPENVLVPPTFFSPFFYHLQPQHFHHAPWSSASAPRMMQQVHYISPPVLTTQSNLINIMNRPQRPKQKARHFGSDNGHRGQYATAVTESDTKWENLAFPPSGDVRFDVKSSLIFIKRNPMATLFCISGKVTCQNLFPSFALMHYHDWLSWFLTLFIFHDLHDERDYCESCRCR